MRFFALAVFAVLAGLVPSKSELRAQQPDAGGSSRACKICVSEPKQNTRKVYASKEEEYCLPSCGLLPLLWRECGCDNGQCGDLRVRHRLIVKKVADRAAKQCVPRELVPGPGRAAP